MTSIHHDDPMTEVLAELGRIVLAEEPLETILDRISGLAKWLLPGAADVSVTLVDKGKAVRAAATGDLAVALDERQYQAGHGPCLDAAVTGAEFHIHDMITETRWPDYSPAPSRSARSVRCPSRCRCRRPQSGTQYLRDQPRRVRPGRRRPGPGIRRLRRHRPAQRPGLRRQQGPGRARADGHEVRAVIEQAKGILVGRRRVSADEAFGILRSLSQTSNRKLRDVAQAVVDMAAQDHRP